MSSPKQLVQKIAQFANIQLNKKNIQRYIQQFKEMVNFTKQVQEPDTTGLEPTFQTNHNVNVMREDRVDKQRILSHTDIKRMSKDEKFKDGYFVIKSETFKSWTN